MSQSLRVAVLGAGLSGLAAARRALRGGQSVTIFERSSRAGGVVQTERRDGWLIERGPNTVQETPAVAELIRELGLTAERLEANPEARNRFVVRGGKLAPLPASPPQFLAGSFFSAATKLKILREMWSGQRPAADSEPSFAAFVREHFGEEVLHYGAEPFVSGTYAGDAERLSAQYAFPRLWQSALKHGSLIRGQMALAKERQAAGQPAAPPLISFRRGLVTLPAALEGSLSPSRFVFGAEITGLRRSKAGWNVVLAGSAPAPGDFDEVVVTLPAKAAADLTVETTETTGTGYLQRGRTASPATGTGYQGTPFAGLADIAHPPVTALFAGFRAAAIAHPLNGFGCLVPPVENRSILGILFSSTLFPNRAPEGHAALTIMLGGALQPGHARRAALESWALARPDVESLLGITEHPVFLEATHWPQAIPQYNLGYGQVFAQIAALEQSFPGLSLQGSYRHGISVPDCLA